MEIGKFNAIATQCSIEVTANEAVYLKFNWLIGCPSGDEALVSSFFVTKKGGAPIEMKLDQLKDAFGWDGGDLYWFVNHSQENTLADIPVRVVVETNDWTDKKGKARGGFQVAWINPVNGIERSGAGLSRADFLKRFGPQFRSVAGPKQPTAGKPPTRPDKTPTATPEPTAAPGVNTGAAGKAKAKPTATRTATVVAESTEAEAWAKMEALAADKSYNEAKRDPLWFAFLEAVAPGKPQDQLTGQEWSLVMAQIEAAIVLPF